MGRFCVIIIFIVLSISCSNPDMGQSGKNISGEENTDSVVVNNLIKKSQANYHKDSVEVSPFDSYLKEAEAIALKSNDELLQAKIYSVVGKRFRNKAMYNEAANYYRKAIGIAERYKRFDLLADYYNQIGVVYRRMDQNPVALDYHVNAMKLAEAQNDSFNIEVALNGIGNINLNLKRYHSAIEYFRRSLEISLKENNYLGQAINNNNIGEAFLGLHEPDSALHYFFLSLDQNRKRENHQLGESICYNSIGDAYVEKGHIGMALKYLKKALDINKKEDDKLLEAVSYNHLGETYLKAGDSKNAIYYLEKGYQIAEKIGSLFRMEESLRLLTQAYELQGDYKKALSYLKLKNTYKDSLINEKNLHYISTLEIILDSEKQNNKIMLLSQERSDQKIKIRQQRIIIITVVLLTLILSFSIVLIIYQNRLRSRVKTLKYQQQLLRSQMNPHFIFNALSAIQLYIMENNKEKAARFLSDFAKLMRHVLKNSTNDYITLRDEIEVIGYYLELQQLRFEKPFKYKIETDAQLDPDNILIPPMLTQPFLENAIEHGFKYQEEESFLKITFMRSNSSLIIEIDDNGQGIDMMMGYKNKDHDSMGLKITKERLEILEKDVKEKTSFTVIDKKRINPFEKGTLVKFVLPIIFRNKEKNKQDG